ncbi:hypothetical protein QRD43_13510 [Pelomonas sp. APW6]|uniref:Haem-binding uptake Tiki superfamily ChaN domain-containing protein n=1 Tax=Roseateles subflavus TaxID=3053353 RepID=A0ABT7LJA0_9BURK|nr:hypothetical protein [Pelomonas sp. APW6]MDL5032927.1 hypothetical protein [Pelomonas sp. APW6]
MYRPFSRSLLLGVLCLAASLARADDCPTPAALAPLLQTDGIFLGELHGSVEVPALVDCLARTLSAELAGRRRVTVALEVPPDALDDAHPFWRGQDGRASQAMVALLRSLAAQQARQQIELIGFVPPEDYPDQADYEVAMARRLDAVPAGHFLLVLAGNFHASRPPPGRPGMGWNLVPAGAHVKRRMAHVLAAYGQASTSWFCMGSRCGAHDLRPSSYAADQAPGLHPLGRDGCDHVFVLPRLSASPPAQAAPPGGNPVTSP